MLKFTTNDPGSALEYLNDNKPDIIFLDIEMPDIKGIEFLENPKSRWSNNIPKIIFTIGYTDYPLSGYEYDMADYILKPVSFARLKKCVDRIIDELNKLTIPVSKSSFNVEVKTNHSQQTKHNTFLSYNVRLNVLHLCNNEVNQCTEISSLSFVSV